MKTSAPEAEELLTIARQELLGELLPAVDSGLKYQVLMIANAMNIARREITEGPSTEQRAGEAIKGFYQAHAPQQAEQADESQLAADIRARRFTAQGDQLHELLLTLTRGKLQISNPKYARGAPKPPA